MKHAKIFITMILITISLLFFSCKDEKPNYNYTNYTEETVKKSEVKKVKKTTETETGEYSFWFVVWEIKGKGTKVNSFIAQPHEGFSMKEFKEKQGEDSFVVNLVEVSYDTYQINGE